MDRLLFFTLLFQLIEKLLVLSLWRGEIGAYTRPVRKTLHAAPLSWS